MGSSHSLSLELTEALQSLEPPLYPSLNPHLVIYTGTNPEFYELDRFVVYITFFRDDFVFYIQRGEIPNQRPVSIRPD
jgi:hypothetical protein